MERVWKKIKKMFTLYAGIVALLCGCSQIDIENNNLTGHNEVGDSQIKLLFNSSILKSGRYYISTYLIGNQKKITNYRYITRQRIPIIIE